MDRAERAETAASGSSDTSRLYEVGKSHDFVKRHGRWSPPSRLSVTDAFQLAWRDYAVKRARGIAASPAAAPAPADGAAAPRG